MSWNYKISFFVDDDDNQRYSVYDRRGFNVMEENYTPTYSKSIADTAKYYELNNCKLHDVMSQNEIIGYIKFYYGSDFEQLKLIINQHIIIPQEIISGGISGGGGNGIIVRVTQHELMSECRYSPYGWKKLKSGYYTSQLMFNWIDQFGIKSYRILPDAIADDRYLSLEKEKLNIIMNVK